MSDFYEFYGRNALQDDEARDSVMLAKDDDDEEEEEDNDHDHKKDVDRNPSKPSEETLPVVEEATCAGISSHCLWCFFVSFFSVGIYPLCYYLFDPDEALPKMDLMSAISLFGCFFGFASIVLTIVLLILAAKCIWPKCDSVRIYVEGEDVGVDTAACANGLAACLYSDDHTEEVAANDNSNPVSMRLKVLGENGLSRSPITDLKLSNFTIEDPTNTFGICDADTCGPKRFDNFQNGFYDIILDRKLAGSWESRFHAGKVGVSTSNGLTTEETFGFEIPRVSLDIQAPFVDIYQCAHLHPACNHASHERGRKARVGNRNPVELEFTLRHSVHPSPLPHVLVEDFKVDTVNSPDGNEFDICEASICGDSRIQFHRDQDGGFPILAVKLFLGLVGAGNWTYGDYKGNVAVLVMGDGRNLSASEDFDFRIDADAARDTEPKLAIILSIVVLCFFIFK